MRIRWPYPSGWGRTVAAITAVTAFTVTGCQATDGNQAGASAGSPSAAVTSASPDAAQPTQSPSSVASASGSLPDVCALLTRSEVSALTGGKSILSVDPDPGPNASVRYCQWQLSGARLAVQLSPTTEARFRQDHPNEERVAGLGDDSYFLSNHLLVRKGTIQIDVYAGTTEGVAADQRLAKAAAATVVARL
jgi:Protein of unknown function (DUF3558)